jgi:integrase/recombinase XerD
MIPIGDRALAWTEKYLNNVRPSIVVEPDEGWLFLTKEGTQLIADHLSSLVKGYVEAANLGKTGACHLSAHHGDLNAGRRRRRSLHPTDAWPLPFGDY